MKKQIIVMLVLVLGHGGWTWAGENDDALWRNHTGDGDFCNKANWDVGEGVAPGAGNNECKIDSNGITHASCDIDVNAFKGPSYKSDNITSELSSGKIRVAGNRYCRIGYYAGGGHLIISGGTLDCRCDEDGVDPGFAVGLFRQGTLTVTDGLVQAKILSLATPRPDHEYGGYEGPASVVNLSGGVIEADGLASASGQASFIISETGKLVLPGEQSLGSLPGWVTFEGGEGVALYDTAEYPGRTVFMVQSGCTCRGNVNRDMQVDLDDLQGVAQILLDAGSPFVVPVAVGDCGDINEDGQIDLDDLQGVAGILLDAGSPFVVPCD